MLTSKADTITKQISSEIGDISAANQEVYNPSSNKYTITRLTEIFENDPIVYACLQLKAARLVELIGTYTNPDKEKENFIHANIANMESSITEVYLQCASAIGFGFSIQEILFKPAGTYKKKQWMLKGFNYLSPEENKASFWLEKNKFAYFIYQEADTKIAIPKWKILHIRNGLLTGFGVRKLFGYPELARVAPFVKLKQFIYQQVAIAAKTRATGVVVGKSHTNVRVNQTILDASGNPIQSGKTISSNENLFNNLVQIKNFSCMVIPKGDEVFSLNLPAGERFWSLALQLCDSEIYKGLLVPPLLLERSIASYTLSDTQLTMFDANIRAIANQVQDQLIEKVFKPLIIWNFGSQEQYGHYVSKEETNPAYKQAKVQEIYQAIAQGILEIDDPEAINFVRGSIGFKALTEEEIEFKKVLKQEMARLRQVEGEEIDRQNAYLEEGEEDEDPQKQEPQPEE